MAERSSTRVQVYLTDRRLIAALDREARQANVSQSQAAGRAMARGLARSLPADPDDRLLHLDRALRDHMRSTARDVGIIQELVVELARAFFLRLPDAAIDNDPVVRAAMERRIERMLDATAARVVGGGSRRADPSQADPSQAGPSALGEA